MNLKQKTEVVKPFLGLYFGLSFLEGDMQQPLLVVSFKLMNPDIIFQIFGAVAL